VLDEKAFFFLRPRDMKRPFKWKDASAFVSVYAPLDGSPPYYHVVVIVLCVLMFGAMCRFDDATEMVRSNIKSMQNGPLVVSLKSVSTARAPR
jgi:hypothetical protein